MNFCKFSVMLAFFVIIGTLLVSPSISAEILSGETGDSSKWGSGWIDLDTPKDFKVGDKLLLSIGGTAANIKVRLLPKGRSPDSTAGMIEGVVAVPKSRTVEIELYSDHPQVIQISVHGGAKPWGKYSLGGDNGPATVDSAELIRPGLTKMKN